MENPVMILGGGGLGAVALDIFKKNEVVVYGILDDDTKLHNTEIDDVSILVVDNEKRLFEFKIINNKLIGFNTLIKNGEVMDTYFLGYDESVQREKMLYLNMLYDMVAYSINKGFKEIFFARTALEIKSSIGAKPQEMFGLGQHSNKIVDLAFEKIFCYLDPTVVWQERNPFK